MYRTLLFIGCGSFLGGIARYLLSRVIQNGTVTSFPLGTLIVNVLGCLIIGLLYGIFDHGGLLNSNLRLFLTVGFCGGFTTFSTFMNEDFLLLQDQNFFYFLLYTVLSLVLGLTATYLGHLVIKIL